MKGGNKSQRDQESRTLSFPDLTPIDHLKSCPRYTSILARPDGHGVAIEEIDSLQMEIEDLLVSAMQRNRVIKQEMTVLDNEKPESIIINPSAAVLPATSLNKSFSSKDLTSLADSNGGKLTGTPSTLNKKFKSFSGKPAGGASAAPPTNKSLNDSNNACIVRNDIPDTFWQLMDPYCASITDDDIKLLEDQLELCDKYVEFPKLGPVGKHYTQQWAEDDLNQQMKESARFVDLDTSTTHTTPTPTPTKRKNAHYIDPNAALIRKNSLIQESVNKINTEASSSNSSLSYGPLTQRLISALVEQNLITPFDGDLGDYMDKMGPIQQTGCTSSAYLSPKTIVRGFQFGGAANSIEKKLKKSLVEQGIIDSESNGVNNHHDENSNMLTGEENENGENDGGEDELAVEIENLQNELKSVTRQCKETIEQLLEVAKLDLERQVVKKKLATVDQDTIDLYEKFKNARFNKKPLTKRDKEKAQRLIKERHSLKTELMSIK